MKPTKDGVKSEGSLDEEGSSWAECNGCFWHKDYLTGKQARSAARYHSKSTGHTAVAIIQRRYSYAKERGSE